MVACAVCFSNFKMSVVKFVLSFVYYPFNNLCRVYTFPGNLSVYFYFCIIVLFIYLTNKFFFFFFVPYDRAPERHFEELFVGILQACYIL